MAWFQIKHRLRPTGAVDGHTLNLLRYRTHGLPRASAPAAATSPAPDAAPVAPAPKPDAAPVAPAPDPVTPSPSAPQRAAGAPRPDAAPATAHPDAAPTAAKPDPDRGNSSAFIVWVLAVLALQLVVLALIRNWPLIAPHLPHRARLAAYRRRLRIPSPAMLRERIPPLPRVRVPKPNLLGLRVRKPDLAKLRGRRPKLARLSGRLPRRAQLVAILLKPARLAAGFVPARRRSTRSQPPRVPARSAAARRGRPSRAAAAPPPVPAPERTMPIVARAAIPTSDRRRVIGYAFARNDGDFARQQQAMEQVCGERGWTLAALVKERPGPQLKLRRRPGLTHVLREVARGGVGHLIVGRLRSLARTPAELAALLEWCSRHEVGLVALDVGLDTTTADGRLAARCLGAVAGSSSRRQAARRRSNGRASGVAAGPASGHPTRNGNSHANGHSNGNGRPTNGGSAPDASEVG